MSLLIPEPYRLSSEKEIKFETYRFYLQCTHDFLIEKYGDWRAFGKQCIKQTQRFSAMSAFDNSWIERWMKISWNTEYLMSVGADDPELMRINNQWAPIQCYYCIYACTEAVAYILDNYKADGHQKSLRKVTNYFVRSGLSPWNKTFKGPRGRNGNLQVPINFPPNLIIPNNLQRYGITPIQMIAKCLKAEHSHRIDDLYNKGTSRYKYQFDPGHTSLLHFIYRLRIKSNYKDVEIFVTEAPEDHIRGFNTSLNVFCFWTLLYMEIILMRKCRKSFIINLAKNYLKLNPKAKKLAQRIKYYEVII